MIRWLLERLEKNPCALFTERELRRYDTEQFRRIRDEGLIRQVSEATASVVHAGRLLTARTNPDGTLEALDDEDVEFDPVEPSPATWARWRFDLAAFGDRFRQANSLSGIHGSLNTRLHLLGETSPIEAVVLALLADGVSGLPILRSLPPLAPSPYERFFVLTASLPVPAREMRGLETAGIFLAQLSASDPLVLPGGATRNVEGWTASGDEPDFQHSPNYTWIRLRGEDYLLPETAAAIAKILHSAHLAGRPYVPWQEIATNIYASPKSMHDAFKTVKNWKALIISERRLYRLNL